LTGSDVLWHVDNSPQLRWSDRRAAIERELIAEGGRHLILVRYPPGHSPQEEWVYNAADIDNAQIVWARDLGENANERLIEHFSGRHLWRLLERGAGSQLEELPPNASQEGSNP